MPEALHVDVPLLRYRVNVATCDPGKYVMLLDMLASATLEVFRSAPTKCSFTTSLTTFNEPTLHAPCPKHASSQLWLVGPRNYIVGHNQSSGRRIIIRNKLTHDPIEVVVAVVIVVVVAIDEVVAAVVVIDEVVVVVVVDVVVVDDDDDDDEVVVDDDDDEVVAVVVVDAADVVVVDFDLARTL